MGSFLAHFPVFCNFVVQNTRPRSLKGLNAVKRSRQAGHKINTYLLLLKYSSVQVQLQICSLQLLST